MLSNEKPAPTCLPSARQPDAAITALSAMHAPHERDSHQTSPKREARSSCPQHGSPMLPSPSVMRAQHERDSRRVRQPPTRSQRPAALSAAAQCCHHRAECEHAQHKRGSHRTSLKREAGTHLPSALQPNAAFIALSALHAQHVRDLHRAHQPQTRSQRPAALNPAAQCCHRRAECHARSARA
jgi:hypothetical protein